LAQQPAGSRGYRYFGVEEATSFWKRGSLRLDQTLNPAEATQRKWFNEAAAAFESPTNIRHQNIVRPCGRTRAMAWSTLEMHKKCVAVTSPTLPWTRLLF
jgi:hypothetical protein